MAVVPKFLSEEFGGDEVASNAILQQGTGLWQHPWVDPPVYATDSSQQFHMPYLL